jgi:hypothetical protein
MSRVRLYAALLAALVVGVLLTAGATAAVPDPPKIDSHPTDPSASSSASFTFSDDKKVTFRCQLDGGSFSDCGTDVESGSMDYPVPPAGPLADGSHTFNVKAVNKDGDSDLTSYQWTIDMQPPVLSISQKPANPTDSPDAHFEFAAADLTSVTYECQLDNGSVEACSPPGKNYSNLTDDTHLFTLKGTDVFGRSSTTSYSWLVETAKPIMTITSSPRNPTNQTSARFTFSSNQKGSTFRCKLDAAGFKDCSSPTTYDGPLQEGAHTFSVKATASAPTTTFSWTIDLTPPAVPRIGSGPSDPTNASNASFAFSDSEAGLAFGCQLDGGGFATCTSPAAYSGVGAGTHTFAVRATDPAGNTGTAAAYGWTVKDGTAPGNVRGLKRTVGYKLLKLTWSRPPDADFDYVRVLVAKGSKAAKGGPLRTSVYKGTGTHYTNKGFKNGTYYRYAIISYDKAGNASRGIPVVVQPSVLLRSPRNGDAVHAPPRLTWVKVPKATFYNVQLYSRGRKILSAWPSASRLGLKRSWSYANRRFKLKTGTYVWYVWPGFGARAKGRYGQLLGQSVFTVR